jgi:hypothetical protein
MPRRLQATPLLLFARTARSSISFWRPSQHGERLGRIERKVGEVRRDMLEIKSDMLKLKSDLVLPENKLLTAQMEILTILHRLDQKAILADSLGAPEPDAVR